MPKMSALHLTDYSDYRTSAGQHWPSTYNSLCYNPTAQVAQQVKNKDINSGENNFWILE